MMIFTPCKSLPKKCILLPVNSLPTREDGECWPVQMSRKELFIVIKRTVRIKGFDRIKKIIYDFIADIESEGDFARIADESGVHYFLLAEAFRGEKYLEKEQIYLKNSFHWAKQEKFVYEYLYLRLAACEVKRKNYEQALTYCDSGLTSKQFITNRLHAESLAVLLFAKSKIYEKMGRPETIREYPQIRKLCQSLNLRKRFAPWWIKE